jgi:pSer/pThr/pTyr-binding forkhead associated (FHA) protein
MGRLSRRNVLWPPDAWGVVLWRTILDSPREGAKDMTTLRVIEGPAKGKSFELEDEIIFLGRGAKNNVQIPDHTVSRMHLKIFTIGTALFVEDLKSSNGTLINGTPLEPGEGHQVDGEDVIAIGDTVVRLEGVLSARDRDFEDFSLRPSHKDTEALPRPERRSRSLRETEFISNLSELLRGPIKLGEALEDFAEKLLAMLPRVDRVAFFVRDKESGQAKQVALNTKPAAQTLALSLKAVEEAFDEGKPVTVADTRVQGSGDFKEDDGGTLEIKSLLCIPMSAHGRVFSVLYLDGIEGPYAYRKEDLLWIETAGTLVAYAIENAELASRLSTIANVSSFAKSYNA